jgi:hypothetical protein
MAADIRYFDGLVVTHTKRIYLPRTLRSRSQTTSAGKRFAETRTRTITITITLSDDNRPSFSRPPHNAGARSTFDSFQSSVLHGVVPRSSLSLPASTPLPSSGTIKAPSETRPPDTRTVAKRSNYPRPSPPCFLYPEPIVPRASHEQRSMQHPSLPGNMTGDVIWYLPYGLEVLIFTVTFLCFAWAVLVCLITFPPRTWGRIFANNDDDPIMKQREKPNWVREDDKMERRPFDKPNKYALQYSVSASDKEVTSDRATTSSSQAAEIYLHDNKHTSSTTFLEEHGFEMKHRTPHRRLPSGTTHPRLQTTATHGAHSPTQSPQPPPPLNSFLYPSGTFHSSQQPLHTHTSSEWLAQHTAFFSTNTSRTLSPNASTLSDHELATADMEALEAGTASSTPRSITKHKRQESWVDLGLARVEDALNGFVGRVARWTDDDGGGEESLLPVVNGSQG